MDRICKLWINGREVAVDPERKLIDILRRDLRLKSVKDGCSEGACGTCTVIIDGKATKACVQKAGRLEGKHIVTVEGLSQREKDVFVYAFGEAGAVQCGFCIPGMVMCGKALIDVNPTSTRRRPGLKSRRPYETIFAAARAIRKSLMGLPWQRNSCGTIRLFPSSAGIAASAIIASESTSGPRCWVRGSIPMT